MQSGDDPVQFNFDACAPKRPESLMCGNLKEKVAKCAGYKDAGIQECGECHDLLSVARPV